MLGCGRGSCRWSFSLAARPRRRRSWSAPGRSTPRPRPAPRARRPPSSCTRPRSLWTGPSSPSPPRPSPRPGISPTWRNARRRPPRRLAPPLWHEAERQAAEAAYDKRQGQLLEGPRATSARRREQLAESGRAQQAMATDLTAERAARAEADSKAAASKQEAAAANEALAKLAAKEEQRGLVITLSGSVLFATNQSALLPGAQTRLDEVAGALTGAKERSVLVEGHTDSRGARDANLALSQRRADAVRSYLVSRGLSRGEDRRRAASARSARWRRTGRRRGGRTTAASRSSSSGRPTPACPEPRRVSSGRRLSGAPMNFRCPLALASSAVSPRAAHAPPVHHRQPRRDHRPHARQGGAAIGAAADRARAGDRRSPVPGPAGGGAAGGGTGTPSGKTCKAIGATAAIHGGHLLEQGFTVSQVVHGYGDVCQALTELAQETDAADHHGGVSHPQPMSRRRHRRSGDRIHAPAGAGHHRRRNHALGRARPRAAKPPVRRRRGVRADQERHRRLRRQRQRASSAATSPRSARSSIARWSRYGSIPGSSTASGSRWPS